MIERAARPLHIHSPWVFITCILALLMLASVAPAGAEGGHETIGFQGELVDREGVAVHGVRTMTFALYTGNDPATGASWSDTFDVDVVEGIFSVGLGSASNPFPADLFDQPLWLGIAIAGDSELTPRVTLGAVPFALTAGTADNARNADTAADADQAARAKVADDSNALGGLAPREYALAGELALHTADGTIHHLRYADSEARTAMGKINDDNPLHHDRFTDDEAFRATLERDGARSRLDADLLDGKDSTDFVETSGGTIEGALDVVGLLSGDQVHATRDGVRFPDGTLQKTAATSSSLPGQQCPPGLTLTGIDGSGDITCGGGLRRVEQKIASTTGEGQCCGEGSMAIAGDGMPMLAYLAGPNFGPKSVELIDCETPSCDLFTSESLASGFDWAAGNAALTMAPDGFARLAYFDGDYDLQFIQCFTPSCSSRVSRLVQPISSINADAWTDIAIGSDGNPVMSVFAISGFDIVHCVDPGCQDSPTVTPIAATGRVGLGSSIAIGTDGLPVISYFDDGTDSLQLLHCGNVDCSAGNTDTTLDSSVEAGRYNDIAIGTAGFPIIAYSDETQGDAEVAHCLNLDCRSFELNTAASDSNVGYDASIPIGADGLPIIAFVDRTGEDRIRVVHCADVACASVQGPYAVAEEGTLNGIVVGDGGLPALGTSLDVGATVIHCGRYDCNNP